MIKASKLRKYFLFYFLLIISLCACSSGGGSSSSTSIPTTIGPTSTPATTTVETTIATTTTTTSSTSTLKPITPPAMIMSDISGREIYGNIYLDTVWEKGVYIINGDVFIPSGIKLTIKPGATIIGKDERSCLQVAGTLEAIGTKTDKILFTTQPSLIAANRKWHGIAFFNSSASKIEYATIDQAISAVELNGDSPIPLKNILFQNNVQAVTDESGNQYIDVQRCTFLNNISAFAGIRTAGGNFSGNDFQDNQQIFEYGYYSGTIIVSNNNFEGAALVARAPAKSSGAMLFKDNWWGTVDTQAIDKLIFDEKNISTLQKIEYLPIKSERLSAGVE
jgi:hypothetical protein